MYKMVKPNVMARIQRKVLKLGKQKALEKRKVGRGVAKEAKIMTKEAKAKAKVLTKAAKAKTKATSGGKQALIRHIFELDDDQTIKDEIERMDNNDRHYRTLYPHMIEPSKKPNKKLKSYKAEFSTKNWRDYEKDDETEGNLMDITYHLKFDIVGGDTYSQWYARFKKEMPDYAKYWLEWYKDDFKKQKK
tara:strand:+ start:338 stop:907 length:570 start_codon:yes stop_codon:yes gene_type:complete